MKSMSRILGLIGGFVLAAQPLFGQTALNQVRLATAVTSGESTQISLTAADNVSAGHVVYIDREALVAQSCNSTTDVCTVRRGQLGTAATPHTSGSLVWTGAANRFYYYSPQPGSRCVRATAYPASYEPWINLTTGTISACTQTYGLGTTVAGYWVTMDTGAGIPARLSYRAIVYPTSRTADATVITPALTVNVWDSLIASLTYTGPFEIFLPAPTGLLGKTVSITDTAGLATHHLSSTAGRTITIRGAFENGDNSKVLARWDGYRPATGATSVLIGAGASTTYYVGITASSMYYWFAAPW